MQDLGIIQEALKNCDTITLSNSAANTHCVVKLSDFHTTIIIADSTSGAVRNECNPLMFAESSGTLFAQLAMQTPVSLEALFQAQSAGITAQIKQGLDGPEAVNVFMSLARIFGVRR